MTANRRRPTLWPLAVLVALLVGLPVAGLVQDVLQSDPEPGEINARVASYRILYRVEDRAGGGTSVSTEELWVRRPFEGRMEVRRGAPPGTMVVTTTITQFARELKQAGGTEDLLVAVEPQPPPGDLRLDQPTLDAALASGLLTFQDEEREVTGRTCHVYRTPTRSPGGEEEGDARDLCVDRAGLVLAEDIVIEGRVARRREAVEVDIDPGLDDSLFEITAELPGLQAGTGNITEVTPASRVPDAVSYELPEGPEGFSRRGRFAFSPASSTLETLAEVSPVRLVGILEVWTDGADYVAVWNGGADNEDDPFRDDPRARSVDLGAPGKGELVVTLAGSEARADLGEGRFVRVFGTLPPDDILDLARRLEPFEGGQVTPLASESTEGTPHSLSRLRRG